MDNPDCCGSGGAPAYGTANGESRAPPEVAGLDTSEHVIAVLPPTPLTFSGLTNGGTLQVPVAQRIRCFGAQEAVLIARLGAGTSILNGQTLSCGIGFDAFTREDPVGQFRSALNSPAGTTFTGPISSATVQYVATSIDVGLGAAFGEYLSVNFTATQAAGGGSFTAVLSLELVLKRGERPRAREPWQFLGYAG